MMKMRFFSFKIILYKSGSHAQDIDLRDDTDEGILFVNNGIQPYLLSTILMRASPRQSSGVMLNGAGVITSLK